MKILSSEPEIFCSDKKNKKKSLGNFGEQLALDKYLNDGYVLIARNYQTIKRKIRSEIDFIVEKNKEIVFVEVKTRTLASSGFGEQAVTLSKKRKINKGIKNFLLRNEKFDDYFPRFDIAVVEIFEAVPKILIFENVIIE